MKRTQHQKPTHYCKRYEEHGRLTANCDSENLSDIPQDLDVDIKVLLISHNNLHNLSENSFQRYTVLNTLSMTGTNLTNPDYYIFRSLKVLETLNLDYLNFFDESGTIFYWPPSIKTLKMHYSNLRDVDLLNLEHLEYLDISNNIIFSFPLLNALAPVKYLNLNVTFMRRISAEDLAPLCQLESLGVDFHSSFNESLKMINTLAEKYCECERLRAWIQTYNIQADPPLICITRRENQKCDLSFSEDVLSLRKECLAKLRGSLNYLFWGIFILVFLAIISGAVAGYFYFQKLKKEMEQENNDAMNLEEKEVNEATCLDYYFD